VDTDKQLQNTSTHTLAKRPHATRLPRATRRQTWLPHLLLSSCPFPDSPAGRLSPEMVCHPLFNRDDADFVIRATRPAPRPIEASSGDTGLPQHYDATDFRVHRVILSISSSWFEQALSQRSGLETVAIPGQSCASASWQLADGKLPVLCLPEDSQTVLRLLSITYPSLTSLSDMSLEEIAPIIVKARMYSLDKAAAALSAEYKRLTTAESAYRSYAIADAHHLPHEAEYAAHLTFSSPLTIESPELFELRSVSAEALLILHQCQEDERERLLLCQQAIAQYHIDPRFCDVWADPSIEVSCKCRDAVLGEYPLWLHNALTFHPIGLDSRKLAGLPTVDELSMALVNHNDSPPAPRNRISPLCMFCKNFPHHMISSISAVLEDIYLSASSEHIPVGLTNILQPIYPLLMLYMKFSVSDRLLSYWKTPFAIHISAKLCARSRKPFDEATGDIALQTSNNVIFFVYRDILRLASPLFETMLSLPQGNSSSAGDWIDEIPCIRIPETSQTLHKLLTFIYPIPFSRPTGWRDSISILKAALKYQLYAMEDLRHFLDGFINTDNAREVFIAAHEGRLMNEAITAARVSLSLPLTFSGLYESQIRPSGAAICTLHQYRIDCRDATLSFLADLRDCTREKAMALVLPFMCAHVRVAKSADGTSTRSAVPEWWFMHMSLIHSDLRNTSRLLTPFDASIIVHAESLGKAYVEHRKQRMCSSLGQAATATTACEEIVKHITEILDKVCHSPLISRGSRLI
jgi:hypothetical protein